ncbi:hypothetical protein BDR04DRAFT_1117532 [Suillus decipiens]|nr:hypothetical protein BDR04DRAFT_1117532 [Suillus decipiens]
MALWSGKGDDQVLLTNLLALKCQHIPEDDDIEEPFLSSHIDKGDKLEDKSEDEIEIKDGAQNYARTCQITLLPTRKITERTHVFTVNVTTREFITGHLEKYLLTSYIFYSNQVKNLVTMLVPPRNFAYKVSKGTITLFDPLCLLTSNLIIAVIHKGEAVGWKYKSEEPDLIYPSAESQKLHFGDMVYFIIPDLLGQHCVVLSTDHAFSGLVKLEFNLDSRHKKMQARLQDMKTVFSSGTQEQVEVYKYYLKCHLINHTLQAYMATQTYVDLHWSQILVGDWIGKNGVVQWASKCVIWFQDESDLLRHDAASDGKPPFIKVDARIIEWMHLSPTIKFTKECRIVSSINFLDIQLTIDTNHDQQEVFVIRGPKEGFHATLYDLLADNCTIAIHGQPCMSIKWSHVATS